METKLKGEILVFAPETILLNLLLTTFSRFQIKTTDLNRKDVDLPREDIQSLSFATGSYAAVLCNHVLEHVRDDFKALQECARVLKPGGFAVFTVPGDFPKSATKEYAKPDDNGHRRHYGMDLVEKMRQVFHDVRVIDMSEKAEKKWRVRKHDYAFICTQ